MTLIDSSQFWNRSDPMSDQVADEDMVERNELGQNVVLVQKGQQIPERLLPQSKPKAKAVSAPPENKARKAPKKS